jgi:hypothetical protein
VVAYCRSRRSSKLRVYSTDIQIREVPLLAEREGLFMRRFYTHAAQSGVKGDRKEMIGSRESQEDRRSEQSWHRVAASRWLIPVAALTLIALLVPQLSILAPARAHEEDAGRQLAPPAQGTPAWVASSHAHAVSRGGGGPASLYSATRQGLLASTDGGGSWVRLPVGGTHDEVLSVLVHPSDSQVIYAGRRDGLWVTQNGGQAWRPLSSPTPAPYVPLAIAIAPSQPGVVYIGTARQGIFRSLDGGASWRDASNGVPRAAAGGRPEEIRALVVAPGIPNTAYLAHQHHGVYRTTDGGVNWHLFSDGLPLTVMPAVSPPHLAVDHAEPGRVYALFNHRIHSQLVQSRVYVTTAGGRWVAVEAELPTNTRFVGMSVDSIARTLELLTSDRKIEIALPTPAREGP